MALESAIYSYMHGLNMIGRHARIELRLPQLATPGVCSAKYFSYICVLIIQPIVVIKDFRSIFYTSVPHFILPFRSIEYTPPSGY